MRSEREISEIIRERGGEPPFTVWSTGFKDVIDGVARGGSPPHGGTCSDVDSAVLMYVDVSSGKRSQDVLITDEPRIVDANGNQVYP